MAVKGVESQVRIAACFVRKKVVPLNEGELGFPVAGCREIAHNATPLTSFHGAMAQRANCCTSRIVAEVFRVPRGYVSLGVSFSWHVLAWFVPSFSRRPKVFTLATLVDPLHLRHVLTSGTCFLRVRGRSFVPRALCGARLLLIYTSPSDGQFKHLDSICRSSHLTENFFLTEIVYDIFPLVLAFVPQIFITLVLRHQNFVQSHCRNQKHSIIFYYYFSMLCRLQDVAIFRGFDYVFALVTFSFIMTLST